MDICMSPLPRPRRLLRSRCGAPLSARQRLQWPLLRALAAAVVSLGSTSSTTATGTTSSTPSPLSAERMQLGDRHHGSQPEALLRNRWLRAHARGSAIANESGLSVHSRGREQGLQARTALNAKSAFLPPATNAGGCWGTAEVVYKKNRPTGKQRGNRRVATLHRTALSGLQQGDKEGDGVWKVARGAFATGIESSWSVTATSIVGLLARRRRRRHRSEGSSPSVYMREGIFQALPFPVRITVMGGGNFGLALSLVLAKNKIPTTLLVRTEGVAEHVNTHREHPNYLKGIKIPPHVHATSDPAAALKDATYIIHAVPVQYTRKFLKNVVPHMPPGAPILSVSKGIETSSLMLMNDILKETCGAERSYAFLSGPSFAREIAMNQATAVVIASDELCLANDFAKVLSSPTFRCFTSKDVIGVEVGGAVKNVIALAAGMCEGLGLGTNAMAGLVTRGCGEMRRMAVILGGNPRTLSGLSGVGDTFGTCFGPLSRNRNFGIRLGKGESMAEILDSSTEVAEGVDTALALADLIRKMDKSYRIDLKYAIIFGVADILKGERSPKEGLEDLMTMPLRAEMYDS